VFGFDILLIDVCGGKGKPREGIVALAGAAV